MVAADEQFNVTFILDGEDSPSDFTWDPGNDFQLVMGPERTFVKSSDHKWETHEVHPAYFYIYSSAEEYRNFYDSRGLGKGERQGCGFTGCALGGRRRRKCLFFGR